jgi:probable HAF family extracellular repeat protein
MKLQRTLFVITAALLATACAGSIDTAIAASSGKAPTAAPASATKVRYVITDLGTLPGGVSSTGAANAITGLIVGGSTAADEFEHATLWSRGRATNIGPDGVNSDAYGVNIFGQVSGLTEITAKDPNNENFCAYGSDRQCRPFVWQSGRMKLLPLLGGYNATVGDNVNLFGQIPGAAETDQIDPTCPHVPAPNGTGPQVLGYKPVLWNAAKGTVRELRLPAGDTVGMAHWVNDLGQAVGASGTCANFIPPPFVAAPHAVMWERDGTPVVLGNLGGAGDFATGAGTHATSINDRGQVVGVSVLKDNATSRAFIWTRAAKMRELAPVAGHPHSAALAINNFGDVVGASGTLPFEDAHAAIWRNGGAAQDLNELVAGSTSLYLLTAMNIDDAGEIVGFGVDTESGEVHAFRATPARGR